MKNYELYHGDCLEIMKRIPDHSIDMILCDLPYGFTDCKWDSVIPFADLWKQYKRIAKKNCVCVLFGNQPFTSAMISSNFSEFSHIWYWKKNCPTNALNAKRQPMRNIEEIPVFVLNQPSKNNEGVHENLRKYFFDELKKSGWKRKDVDKLLNSSMSSHYFTNGQQFVIPSAENYKKLQDATGCFQRPYEEIKKEFSGVKIEPYTYNPQGVRDLDKPRIKREHEGIKNSVYSDVKPKTYKQTKTGYPVNLLEIKGFNSSEKARVHPTQKPVELLEYLIKTYSNEGETVLDNCMGSGSTGVACMNTNRKFIGIELDKGYFNIAERRIADADTREDHLDTG